MGGGGRRRGGVNRKDPKIVLNFKLFKMSGRRELL